MEILNFNKKFTTLHLSGLECGRTRILAKVGYKVKVIDIDKNKLYSNISIYDLKKDKNGNICKYSSILYSIYQVNNNYIIDRNFIENIKEIAKAKEILKKYNLI